MVTVTVLAVVPELLIVRPAGTPRRVASPTRLSQETTSGANCRPATVSPRERAGCCSRGPLQARHLPPPLQWPP